MSLTTNLFRVFLPPLAGLLMAGLGADGVWAQGLSVENYCVRCHEPHAGLDYTMVTCMDCHEEKPMGHMGLIPWYTSEGAIAGILCNDCHGYHDDNDDGFWDACLYCHTRHSDPER